MDIQTAWEKTGEYLKERLGKTTFDTWLAPLKAKIEGESRLVIQAPDNFFKDWVETHYRVLLQEAVTHSFAKNMEISLEVGLFTNIEPSLPATDKPSTATSENPIHPD